MDERATRMSEWVEERMWLIERETEEEPGNWRHFFLCIFSFAFFILYSFLSFIRYPFSFMIFPFSFLFISFLLLLLLFCRHWERCPWIGIFVVAGYLLFLFIFLILQITYGEDTDIQLS